MTSTTSDLFAPVAASSALAPLDVAAIVAAVAGILPGPAALHEPTMRGREWDYVKECLDSGWVSYAGQYVERFERMLEQATGVRHAVAMASGTAALHTGLIVCGIRPGDEVLVPALTFVATANAVAHAGAIPTVNIGDRQKGRLRAASVIDCVPERQANCEAGLSARLTQTGRCDTHRHGLAQDLDQHHDPTLAIGHLVDALNARERCFRETHALARLEQAFRLGLDRCFLCSQQFDQAIIHPRRFDTETDQPTDPLGRTDRRPTLGRISLAQTDEQVAWKQGLVCHR